MSDEKDKNKEPFEALQDHPANVETFHDLEALDHAKQLAVAHDLIQSSGERRLSDETQTPSFVETVRQRTTTPPPPSEVTSVDLFAPEMTAPPLEAPEVPAPDVIADRYDVISQLGEGGMGFVYKVRDRQLSEDVALKLLRPELLDNDQAIERFKREVKLARRVTHPNVARTYDIGTHEGVYFLTMEFVEGESLSDLMEREGALDVTLALEIATSMALGLAAAHKAHVIHRDLKPANVLIDGEGRVLLSDFGIAGVDFLTAADDATGSPLGTPAYMSPEQLQGRHDIDVRADVYSLGLIMYEMLSGRRAWLGENPFTLIYSRLSGDMPPPLQELRPGLSQQLVELIDAALIWERDVRIQSADAMVAALQALHRDDRIPEAAILPTSHGLSSTVHEQVPRWQRFARRAATPTQIGEKRVAVLPFRSASDDTHLTEGLTEDLCDLLSMLSGIRVRSMRLVRSLAVDDLSIEALADKLQVDVLIEGSIRRMGERLVIPVRLLSAEDGNQIWARRFQCSVSDIFSISEQAAAAVAEALTLQSKLTARLTTTNPEAIELYFRARQEQRKHWHGDLSSAIVLYNRAMVLVPDDPLILTGAAVATARDSFFQTSASPKQLSDALSLAERAIAASPTRGEPYLALGLICYYDLKSTARSLDALCTALERLPDMPEANEVLGRLLLELGPLDAGTAFVERARQLDPQNVTLRWDLMRAYAMRGEWGKVDTIGDLPVEHPQDLRVRTIVRARLDVWRDGEPRWLYQDARDFDAGHPILGQGTAMMVSLKREGKLPAFMDTMVESVMNVEAGTRWHLAALQMVCEALAFVGEEEQFFRVLHFALELGLIDLVWLEHCPLFVPLRGLPAYREAHGLLKARVDAIHASCML